MNHNLRQKKKPSEMPSATALASSRTHEGLVRWHRIGLAALVGRLFYRFLAHNLTSIRGL